MADPRNIVRHEGTGDDPYQSFIIDNSTITFDDAQTEGSAMVGKAVTMTSTAKTVALAADGNLIVGQLERVEKDLKCRVKVRGWINPPGGNGATLTHGTKVVGAVGVGGGTDRGYVRSAASAGDALLARGFIEDSSDATKVGIQLAG